MEDMDLMQYNIADMVMEKPLEFYIDDKRFCIYPVTLGKSYLLQRLLQSLQINQKNIEINPFLEALRLCESKSDIVSKVIAYHTIKEKEKLFDERYVNEVASFLQSNTSVEDLAKVLLYVLTNDNVDACVKYLGLEEERKEQKRVLKIKNEKSNILNYGGKSIYGSLIDAACERYGWSMEYVVWGISYANLRMLIADMTTSISLTDEEKRKARVRTDGSFIDGDDPANIERIKALFQD